VTTETKPSADQAQAAPSVAEQIRSWLPDHCHVQREFTGATVWTWTTPAGVWGITVTSALLQAGHLTMVGPGGQWAFGRPNDGALRELRGMLLALGAIGGES